MIKCGVIKDLLPLYADDICSEESRELVQEHLKECIECKEELETYKYNVGIGEVDDVKAVADFGRKLKKKNLVKIIVSVVLCVAVIVSAGYFVFVREFYVPYSEGILEYKIPVDGGIDIWVNLDNYKRLEYDAFYSENNTIDIYITVKQTVFTKMFKDPDMSDHLWRTNGFVCMSFQDETTDYIHPDCKVTNIYYTDLPIYNIKHIWGDDDSKNDIEIENARHLIWSAE